MSKTHLVTPGSLNAFTIHSSRTCLQPTRPAASSHRNVNHGEWFHHVTTLLPMREKGRRRGMHLVRGCVCGREAQRWWQGWMPCNAITCDGPGSVKFDQSFSARTRRRAGSIPNFFWTRACPRAERTSMCTENTEQPCALVLRNPPAKLAPPLHCCACIPFSGRGHRVCVCSHPPRTMMQHPTGDVLGPVSSSILDLMVEVLSSTSFPTSLHCAQESAATQVY